MDFLIARENMVNCQLKPNKVNDERVLDAFFQVPRELFVKKTQIYHSYLDDNLPIYNGRHLINPVVLARLIQSLELKRNQSILNLASGIGYGIIILSYLAETVIGIESDKRLIENSLVNLQKLKIDNVAVIKSNINKGFLDQAPYDAILIEGGVDQVPEIILNQLSKDCGKLVTVENEFKDFGRAVLYQRENEKFIKNILFDAHVPVLNTFRMKKTFVL